MSPDGAIPCFKPEMKYRYVCFLNLGQHGKKILSVEQALVLCSAPKWWVVIVVKQRVSMAKPAKV